MDNGVLLIIDRLGNSIIELEGIVAQQQERIKELEAEVAANKQAQEDANSQSREVAKKVESNG